MGLSEDKMRVAIYAGAVPSTMFIERLIEGLAGQGTEILLFGQVHARLLYTSPNIRVLGWRYRWEKWGLAMGYALRLLLSRPWDVFVLLRQLPNTNWRMRVHLLIKFLPVLWHRPDVFHIQWAKSLPEWAWVQHFGMKLVLSLRGAHINYSPIVDEALAENYRRLFPLIERFHAVSEAIKKEAQQYGAAAQRIHVVYSGLDLRQFPFKPLKQIHQPLKMITVGRSHWKKGYPYALDACQLLRDRNIDFVYQIVDGRAEEYLFQLHQLGLKDRVELMDAQPFEAIQRLIAEADVLLLPSVEEGIANVVLEAMALGTPVISTDCGGMAEVIEDGVNGFLVPSRDATALAAAVVRFRMLNEADRLGMAQKARRTVEERFSVEQMVRGMLQLYEEVISQAPVRRFEVQQQF